MEPPSSRTRLVVAEGNLRGFRGLTVDAFGCLLRGGPGQLPNAMRKVVGAREETRNVQSPEDLWRDTFRRYIRANPFLSFREVHRKTIQDFFKALGISEDVDGSIDAAFDEYRSSSAYPEVSAVLRDVEQEVPVAVVSNMDTTALLGALQRNGLTFTFIITSDEEQRYKPDPSLVPEGGSLLGPPRCERPSRREFVRRGHRRRVADRNACSFDATARGAGRAAGRSAGDGARSPAGARFHPELLERIVAPLAPSRLRETTRRPRECAGHLGRHAGDAGCGGPMDSGARLRQRRASRPSESRVPGGGMVAGTDE